MDCSKLIIFERLLKKYQDSFESLHDSQEPCKDDYLVRDYLRAVNDLYDFISTLR